MKIKIKCDVCQDISEFIIKQFNNIDEKNHFRIHPNIGLQIITADRFAQLNCKTCKSPIAVQMNLTIIQNAVKSLERFKNKEKKVVNKDKKVVKKNERNRR